MTRETLIIAFRFIFLVLVQVVILNNIYFFDYINPNLYVLFVLLYPIETKRANFLVISFLLGLTIDIFSNSGGINAAATVAMAYLSFPILKIILNSPDTDFKLFRLSEVPFLRILFYVSTLVFIHHFVLFSLEYANLNEIGTIFYKTINTSIFTIFLCTVSIYLTGKTPPSNL